MLTIITILAPFKRDLNIQSYNTAIVRC